MPGNHINNHKIEITSLIDDAIENAIARREQSLTLEEAEKIKGGDMFIDTIISVLGYFLDEPKNR